jgi:hypothetical protein
MLREVMTYEGWRDPFTELVGFVGCPPGSPVVTGAPAGLPSRLPTGEVAVACVAAALTAAAGLGHQRGGARPPQVWVDAAHAAAAVRSEALLRVNGRGFGSGFAELSRFWRAADGWVRTHANYQWHRDALLCALGTAADPEAVGAAIRELPAEDVETAVVAAGGVAAAVRTSQQWRRHPQGRALADRPLIVSVRFDGALPRRHEAADLPAAGLRVLDMTRVIAGPVATRYLAALGAEVLRIDPPHRPELPVHRYDGLPGKRSAMLDMRTRDELERLHELLGSADILVHGYRPGALAKFGLEADSLADRHPGLVVVSISAWGRVGPWGDRRGFDSIVQAASGIAMVESPDGDRPGKLPCQLLDHGTGYLAAAAALEGIRRQSRAGGTHAFELTLAATAAWLLRQPTPAIVKPSPRPGRSPGEWLTTLQSDAGPVTVITPPGTLDGRPLNWPGSLTTYGQDRPTW